MSANHSTVAGVAFTIFGIVYILASIVAVIGVVIGTSALAQYDIDGAVGMYSGIFNNPFMIWGKHKRGLFKITLRVSFQFHHTQMDGAHAARFLDLLQREIDALS